MADWGFKEGELVNSFCPHRDSVKNCEFCDKSGKLQTEFHEEQDLDCPNSKDSKIKILGRVTHGKSGVKMSVNQIQNERKQRSTENFKKEIFPTFTPGSEEHKHFKNKHSDLK